MERITFDHVLCAAQRDDSPEFPLQILRNCPNALLWNSLHGCIRHRAYNSNGFLAIIPNLTIRASKSLSLARTRSFFSGDGGKRLGCVHSTIIRAIWCRFHQGSIEWKAGSASGVHCPRSLFVGSPSSLFLRDRDDMVMSRSGSRSITLQRTLDDVDLSRNFP